MVGNDQDGSGEGGTLRYDPDTYDAYCKYCYQRHRRWVFFGEYWLCEVCERGTADEYMQIEGVAPSPEQIAFYDRTTVTASAWRPPRD